MVKRTNPEYNDTTKRVLLILKQGSPLRPQADTQWSEIGLMSGMDIILDLDSVDYPDVAAASKFTVQGLTYELKEFKPFSVANENYRYLIYGQED